MAAEIILALADAPCGGGYALDRASSAKRAAGALHVGSAADVADARRCRIDGCGAYGDLGGVDTPICARHACDCGCGATDAMPSAVQSECGCYCPADINDCGCGCLDAPTAWRI